MTIDIKVSKPSVDLLSNMNSDWNHVWYNLKFLEDSSDLHGNLSAFA